MRLRNADIMHRVKQRVSYRGLYKLHDYVMSINANIDNQSTELYYELQTINEQLEKQNKKN